MSAPTRPVLGLVGKAPTDVTPLDYQLDQEVSAALTVALASATPTQRLALLTLLQTPGAPEALERLIAALLRGAR
jgi:hypothetical protein